MALASGSESGVAMRSQYPGQVRRRHQRRRSWTSIYTMCAKCRQHNSYRESPEDDITELLGDIQNQYCYAPSAKTYGRLLWHVAEQLGWTNEQVKGDVDVCEG